MWKRYAEVALDVAIAGAAYYFLGWIGFALAALFIVCWFAIQLIGDQQTIMRTSAA